MLNIARTFLAKLDTFDQRNASIWFVYIL